jgi:hypothetical protein
MNALRALAAFLVVLLLFGCTAPTGSHRYVGVAAHELDWPYRYNLVQTNGWWAGTIDRRDTNGWVFWDTMELTHQDAQAIRFKARVGDRADFHLGWYLSLGAVTPQGFSAMLTGDLFDSRAIELVFEPCR